MQPLGRDHRRSPDDVRLFNLELLFTCQACGLKGAEVRRISIGCSGQLFLGPRYAQTRLAPVIRLNNPNPLVPRELGPFLWPSREIGDAELGGNLFVYAVVLVRPPMPVPPSASASALAALGWGRSFGRWKRLAPSPGWAVDGSATPDTKSGFWRSARW
jgi:hypothetical protein